MASMLELHSSTDTWLQGVMLTVNKEARASFDVFSTYSSDYQDQVILDTRQVVKM